MVLLWGAVAVAGLAVLWRLAAVLHHERHHLRHRDPLTVPAVRVCCMT